MTEGDYHHGSEDQGQNDKDAERSADGDDEDR
jgi:hypothetical protein